MISAASQCVRHRGPDDSGEWWSSDRRVAFGHRRLSIVDLSVTGHQPMTEPDGDNVVVFNGEIYNHSDLRNELIAGGHKFRGSSDTEVLLAGYREWGAEVLPRLNGMFSMALYDMARSRLFLARDRAGEKPLFYRVRGGEIRFASELKSLMAAPDFDRDIDLEALDCYLAMGYIPGDRSILRGVHKLPPAHAMYFDLAGEPVKIWRYWTAPDFHAPAPPREELLAELEPLLEDAVRRQLAADVPVGVLLSGGVDSSLITAMAVRSSPHVKTFTVALPGGGRFDESGHARLIARHFRTEHIELTAEAGSVGLLPQLAQQFDEPMVDSSMIPTYLVSQVVRQHCTVALGGDGGDELFGGYGHYRRFLHLERTFGRVPRPIRRVMSRAGTAVLPVGYRGRNWVEAIGSDLAAEMPPIDVVFDAAARRRLMQPRAWSTPAEGIRRQRTPKTRDIIQRATRMDFQNYLPEDVLVKVDRASMLTSLEVRAPFLDHRVIEFAFGRVPSHEKATESELKVLLKALCARVLPPEFDRQRKQGFSIPLAAWLRDPAWDAFFREVLLDSGATFERRFASSLLDGQARGRDNSERLFGLVMFELWRRHYDVSV